MARNSLAENEEHLVSRFIGGLRLQIQNTLLQFNPSSVSEAHQRAFFLEQQSRSVSSSWNPSRIRSNCVPEIGLSKSMDPLKLTDSSDGRLPNNQQRSATFKCFKCGEQGHRQSDCPKQNRRGLFSTDEPIFDEYEEGEAKVEEEEQVLGDVGTMLMLRRNHLIPNGVEESWLRTNIFQSTCTIRGKVCRLVIDSGSCTNVISEEVVSKLALFTESHPTPYSLAWLNSKTDMRVSKRCRVPFSIGVNYKDLVCCDVVPMDASSSWSSLAVR